MKNEQKWLMIDMHMHSQYSRIRKPNDDVKEMSVSDFVDTLHEYGINIFSITDHNYFSHKYYNDIDAYIESKGYNIKVVNGVELDVYVDLKNKPDAFIHICFYFDESADREKLHDIIENLYGCENAKPRIQDILIKLSDLNCKIISIPHGDKDNRGLLDRYKIDQIIGNDKKEYYKYAMYKVFNAFDIKPGSIGKSEEHWALEFYEKTEIFAQITKDKSDEDINALTDNIVRKLKGEIITLSKEEETILEYVRLYGSFFAYFSFSDWHNNKPYAPLINNFVFGSLDFAFSVFELATFDPISRIEKTKDKSIMIPESLIKTVSFNIGSDRKEISFSPGLNAIVGKRGSGKSLLVSVLRNLYDSDDSEGAIKAYSRLKINNISCTNRGGIDIGTGHLGSIEFLKQNEIRDIVDNPEKAQAKIRSKFPLIKDLDLSAVDDIINICNKVKPFNNNYKSITTELSFAHNNNEYIFKKHKIFDSSVIEGIFDSSLTYLYKVLKELNDIGFSTIELSKSIKTIENYKNQYLKCIDAINGILVLHNNRINQYNDSLSINRDQFKRNIESLNSALSIISDNFSVALYYNILLHKVNTFSLKIYPASISREGKYLFATYYDFSKDIKQTISDAILDSITYSSDNLSDTLLDYINGNEKRKLKSDISSLGDGLLKLKSSSYFSAKNSFFEISNENIDYISLIKSYDLLLEHIKNGDLIDLNNASLGTKSVAYLNMLFDLDDKILVFDQPEDNIDNDYISRHLVPTIKRNKKIKQLIFVTHNPSVAVYGDAFNYIYAENNEKIVYSNYFIERIEDKEKLLNILEGGRYSFSNRNKKYGDIIGDENYGSKKIR